MSQVKAHLQADLGYQSKLVRFLENHDEERAAESWKDTRQAFFFLFLIFPPPLLGACRKDSRQAHVYVSVLGHCILVFFSL